MYSIGLDLRPTEAGFKAHFGRGIGRYARELIRQLKLLEAESGCSLVELSGDRLRGKGLRRNLVTLAPAGKITLETQWVLPKQMQSFGLDGIHFFSHPDAPAWSPVPYMVTVADLIPLKFPELYKTKKANWRYRFGRYLENRSIESAEGIFAISESTKRDIIELRGVRDENIVVTPLAVGAEFKPISAEDLPTEERQRRIREIRRKLRLPETAPLLLYVGGIDQRKNIPFLLQVFSELHRNSSSENKPVLVLVGAYEADILYPDLLAEIKRLNLADSVVLYGFIEDALLPELYQSATVMTFPSLYEGFGFPVLEAMACGTPVVAGHNSSIPEVAGARAMLLPDNDRERWVRGLKQLIEDRAYADRLSVEGISQASRFSWRRSAEQTLAGYKYFLDRKGRRLSASRERFEDASAR